MPSALSQSCMKFRLETLAPSGGWLASVAIGLSIKTGIYEYTILAIIFMISFIILRTASCESAMVLALAYDLVIPFQYQNVQRHLAELEQYWPKFVIGTVIEGGCYFLLHSDLFNLAVIIKTSVLLIIWMKGRKQYPLNLAKDTQPPAGKQPTSTAKQPSASSSSSNVTREYLDYVMKEFAKATGDLAVTPERANEHRENLKKPAGSEKRVLAEASLKKRKIMLFDQWKAAQAAGGQGGGSSGTQAQGAQPSKPITHMPRKDVEAINEALKAGGMEDDPRRALMHRLQKPFSDPDWEAVRKEMESAGITLPTADQFIKADAGAKATAGGGDGQTQASAQNQAKSTPAKFEYQWTKPTDADVAQLKLDLVAKKSSIANPEDVIVPLLAGPTHAGFAKQLNYLRHKGINTRKWVAMVPADQTGYRVKDSIIDECVDIMEKIKADVRHGPMICLKDSYPTKEAWDAGMKGCSGCVNMSPGFMTTDVKVTHHGEPWYDYPQKIATAKVEGPEEVARVENIYDYLNDPYNKPKPKEDSQKAKWWSFKEADWEKLKEPYHVRVEDNDWIPGKAGIPCEEISEYRAKLNAVGEYGMETKNAIISAIKNHSNADQGRAILQPILDRSTSVKGILDVIKEWEPKTRSGLAYEKALRAEAEKKAKEAAERAAEASQGGT